MDGRQGPPAAAAGEVDAAELEAAIDLAGLRRWVVCVCVVNFDVDYGQVIEYQCPRGSLTEEEGTALCYMSFPDSHATSLGDTEFVFRVRRSAPAGAPPNAWRPSIEPETDDGSGEAAPFEDATHSRRYLYGYTLFRQVKDPAHPRGTFQKSIVVVSSLPYVRLFRAVARLAAPAYFGGGRAALARLAAEISRWPDARGGCTLELPVNGVTIRARLCVMSMRLGALGSRMRADAAEARQAARAAAQAAAGGAGREGCGAGLAGASPPPTASPPPSPERLPSRPATVGEAQHLPRRGAHACEAPLPARASWAEADGAPERTRSVPAARALAVTCGALPPASAAASLDGGSLPPRPSLGDALASALDCFAPFQDISLLRAFSPAPAAQPLTRAHSAAARAGADADAPHAFASPPPGAPGSGGCCGCGAANSPSSALGALAALGVGGGGAPSAPPSGASAYEELWRYWELVLSGACILVHSSSPTRCSDAVLALVSLVAPIPFCGDFRPYFTIHDADFERYTTAADEPPPAADGSGRGAILGVTNPYFLKLRQPWHALLSLDAGGAERGALQPAPSASNLEAMMSRAAGGSAGGAGRARRPLVVTPDTTVLKQLADVLDADAAAGATARRAAEGEGLPPLARRAESDLSAQLSGGLSAQLSGGLSAQLSAAASLGSGGRARPEGSGAPPPVQRAATLTTASARAATPPPGEGERRRAMPPLSSSPARAGAPSPAGARAAAPPQHCVSASAHKIGNELLRQHFRELTGRFLRPLEAYGSRGFVPAQADWARPTGAAGAGAGGAPAAWMQTFDRERFLRELSVTEPSPLPRSLVSRRSDLLKLYEAFLDTPHFRLWWHERRSETLRSINQSYQEKLLATAAAKAAADQALLSSAASL